METPTPEWRWPTETVFGAAALGGLAGSFVAAAVKFSPRVLTVEAAFHARELAALGLIVGLVVGVPLGFVMTGFWLRHGWPKTWWGWTVSGFAGGAAAGGVVIYGLLS